MSKENSSYCASLCSAPSVAMDFYFLLAFKSKFACVCQSQRGKYKCPHHASCPHHKDVRRLKSWTHLFLIHTGWVCIHGNFQEWLRFITMFWNCLYCLNRFFLPHFVKDLWRKRKIWERWSGPSEDNSIFAFTLLATEVEFYRNGVETWERPNKKIHLEWNNIWTFPYNMNIQHAWLSFFWSSR